MPLIIVGIGIVILLILTGKFKINVKLFSIHT